MKRIIQIGHRTLTLEWTHEGERLSFRFDDGPPREASIVEVEPGIYSVLCGQTTYEVRLALSPESYVAEVRGREIAVQVIDPRANGSKRRAGSGEGRISLRAPIPGRVVRVLVNAGDEVRAGQGLVVIEAMKMQNELKAPKAGRVVSVETGEAQAVAAGQVLVVVE